MHSTTRTLLAATLAALPLAPLAAHHPPKEPSPSGLLIADGGQGGILEIVRQDVRVVINNGIAVTTVDQVFHNTEGRQVEALYTFPVPKNASVANFSMWIGGKEMIGEVVEKVRAREIYESYKRRNVDPGLLEQVDYKTFEMRIFPIAADAEQRVRVEYYQELDVDGSWCTYVYPLATTTRPGLDAKVKGPFTLNLAVKSGVPILDMHSTSHRDDFVVAKRSPKLVEASLELTGTELTRDLVLAWRLERPRTGLDFITSKTEGEDGFVQITLTAGAELEGEDVGMDYIFVADISGSMANDGKLAVSRESIDAFVKVLDDRDRFDIITFNAGAATLFGALTTPDPKTLQRASEFLLAQRARGGTRLQPAIETAFRYLDKDRPLNVVVLSDGITELEEVDELIRLVRGRPSGARLFCIGIGNDVNRPLLRQAAKSTGGLAAFLSRGDDLARQAQGFRRKLTRPAIADVQIQVAGGSFSRVEPKQMPNLYHGAPVRIYARYRRPGAAKITLTGTLQGAPFRQEYQIDLPATDRDNPEIERMWAWHQVQRLMDEERAEGNPGTRVPQIVELCEGFSIPGEHASFLVLENDAEYATWKIERRNATRLTRDRAAQERLRARLDAIRDESERQLGPKAAPAIPASAPATGKPASKPGSSRIPRTIPTAPGSPESGDGASFRGGGGGGGGAVDPLTGCLAFGLAFTALATRRRRRRA